MPRKRSLLFSLGILGGCVVAFVQAQDYVGRPTGSTSSDVAPVGAPGEFAVDARTRPIGEFRSTLEANRSGTSNRRRGNLAERLKAARAGESAPASSGSNYQPARQTLADGDSASPTLADPAVDSAAESAPALVAPGQSSRTVEGYSPTVGEPLSEEAEPPAREARLPSVLKRTPNTWRSQTAPPAEASEAVEPTETADSPAAPNTLEEPPSLSDAPDNQLEIGSGRAAPTARSATPRQPVAATSSLPSLRVHTTGPAAVVLGKEATWRVEIENTGAENAHEVAISLYLPSTVEVVGSDATLGAASAEQDLPEARGAMESAALAWSIPELESQARATLEIRAIPKSAGSFELKADWTCRPTSIAAQVEVQEPKLEITITGPAEVRYGQTQLYTVIFSNPGTGDAENVSVSLAPLTAGERGVNASNVGVIPAGAKKQMQIELVARQAGTMDIKLRATADGGLEAEAARQVKVKCAQLQVAIRGPRLHYAGSPATYRLTVTNVGDAVAEDVSLAADLPPGAKPVGKSSSATSWSIGDLAPGAEREVDFACEFSNGGECAVAALAEAAGNLTASAETTTQVEAIADLKLVVNDPQGAQPVGEDAVYELVITNRGARAAQQVEVLAQFSDGIEPAAAAGGQAEIVTGQVIFAPVAEVAPGQTVTLKITARAEQPGNHVFRAEVRCADPETKLVSENTTRYFGEASKP